MLFDEIEEGLFIGLESCDHGRFVVLHQAAVTGDVGAEDGGELAVKALLLHGGTSISWKTHHVVKGLVPAAIGPIGGRMKLSSDREGKVDFQ
jgi:hypothetical protein